MLGHFRLYFGLASVSAARFKSDQGNRNEAPPGESGQWKPRVNHPPGFVASEFAGQGMVPTEARANSAPPLASRTTN